MRKISVIGASLLLLALGSCSREKETTPADGFVKMRFTAVVGETRTAYENDKTVSWVAGDAISVYVTNGTDGQVVNFTAGEDLTFEGSVPAGYTTIVAGAYPADAAHTFDATGVKTLHLPASYTLAEGADPASILPLAGTYADGVMTFRHPAGALKFTIDNVPATAVRFRFTAAGQKVNGSFAMDPALAATEVEAEQSVDITVPAAEGSRSFYVPMPAGELAAGAAIALYDAENNLLFQKTVPQALTVSKNVIKRIAAVETWKKNEEWQVAYLKDAYSTTSNKVSSHIQVKGTTASYDLAIFTKGTFDSRYNGLVENFLASDYIADKKAAGASPKTKNTTWVYTRLSPGIKNVVIFGLDENYNFTGEYNFFEFEVPEFTTPEGWHLEFNPTYRVNGIIHPAVHIQVPQGTSYSYSLMKKSVFQNSYGGDAPAYIWTRTNPSNSVTIRTNADFYPYYTSLDETDYVFILYGVREAEQTGGNRILSYQYALLEFTYTAPSDEPTEAYNAWIGTWSVDDGTHTDTWTITADKNNETYKISGLVGLTSSIFVVAGFLNEDGTLQLNAQMDIRTFNGKMTDGNTYPASLALLGRKTSSGSFFTYQTNPYPLLKATMGDSGSTATLAPAGTTYLYYTFVANYVNANGESKWAGYGTRPANATMTAQGGDEVMAPDDWDAAEDFIQGPEPVVIIDALPGE